MWHDIHTEFHKDWFRYSEVDRWDTQTHRQHCDSKPTFFKIRKVGYEQKDIEIKEDLGKDGIGV
jgi:hypothetical protein